MPTMGLLPHGLALGNANRGPFIVCHTADKDRQRRRLIDRFKIGVPATAAPFFWHKAGGINLKSTPPAI